jgi:hypothetical protein
MNLALVLLSTAGGAMAGRLLFGRWFNHVTVYSAAWGASLALVTLDLIHYYPITARAWGWIAVAWLQVVLGAVLVLAITRRTGTPPSRPVHPADDRDLARVILALSVLGSLAIVGSLLLSARQLGGWLPAFTSGVARRYQARLAGEVPAEVPYLSALLLAGCAFGGVRAARRGQVDLMGLLPLLLLVLHGITIAARAMIGIGGVAYLSALLLPRPSLRSAPVAGRAPGASRRVLVLLLTAGVALGGFTLVSATRGLTTQLPGVDPRLVQLSRTVPFLPSIYGHISASPVAFSEYLKADPPRLFPSAYTFAPAWRLFARVTGAPTAVPYYEENYYTPVESNVATWLKNIHADFGAGGLVLFPFAFSALLTAIVVRADRHGRVSTHVLAASLLPVLLFSFLVNLMMHGYWVIGTAVAWLVALVLDARAHRRTTGMATGDVSAVSPA